MFANVGGHIADTAIDEHGPRAGRGGEPATSPSAAWLRDRLQGKWALLHLLPVAGRRRAAALVAVLVFDAVTPVLFSVATGVAVGSVPAVARHGLSSAAGRHLGLWLLVLSVALVLQRVSGPVRSAITSAFARAVDLRLRDRVMDAALAPTGVGHLEDPEILDLVELSRGVSVWGASPGQAVAGLSMILSVRFTGIIALVILSRFKWWLPVVLGAVAWGVVRTKYRLYLQMSTHVTSKAEELRRSRYFRDLVLSPDAAKEMRVFGLSGWMRGRFNLAWLAAMVEVWRARGRGAPLVFIAMLARFGAALFTVTLIARAGVAHQISLAAVIVFAQAVDNSAVLSYTLGNPELFVQQGLTGTASAFELERRLPALASAGTRPADHLPTTAIRFEGVRFRYRGRDRDVFESLDLEIAAGRSLAIVGENGAGKTTIVKLLTRLHQPDADASPSTTSTSPTSILGHGTGAWRRSFRTSCASRCRPPRTSRGVPFIASPTTRPSPRSPTTRASPTSSPPSTEVGRRR